MIWILAIEATSSDWPLRQPKHCPGFVMNRPQMWQLWLTAKETHSRPSELVCEENPLVAYLLDSAVVTFGRTVENHLEEMINNGSDVNPKWESKYKLYDILSKDFKFPVDKPKKSSFGSNGHFANGIAQVLALAEQNTGGIKRWEYKPN